MRDRDPAGDSAAWAAFLPAGAAWLPGNHGRPRRAAARRLRRALAGLPKEARLAAAASPWALRQVVSWFRAFTTAAGGEAADAALG